MNRENAIEYFNENCKSNEEFKVYWESLSDEQREVYIQDLMKQANDFMSNAVDELNKVIQNANKKMKRWDF